MRDHPEGGRKPNRLIHEQSPYLRQHAFNPVDWYPWGAEALAKAKAEDRPILLSIGYSACHWCHVMERESFENNDIAGVMNENFVCIKVDREERPDLDHIYMDAIQLLTGRGGWPLTAFLTPDCKPFFGGTYFPPQDRHGIPGFPRVLKAVAEAYRNRRADVEQNVDKLTRAIGSMSSYSAPAGELRAGLAAAGARAMTGNYDSVNGGIGAAPKFPNTFVLSLFLRIYAAEDDSHFGEMVRHSLTKMAKGGIYDQIGGGFHRYSVDDRWLVPHFEKMLYDNALLARLYLDAGRALKAPEFVEIARETLDYVLREMTSPEGGFYSSQDADSEGEEGKFFVWTPAEVRSAVGDDLAPIAARYFDVTEEGNFEGRNILHRTIDAADLARLFKMSEAEALSAVRRIKTQLFQTRESRVKPGRDDKILAAWNAMMIGAFAEGYRATREQRYLDAAKRASAFVLERLWDGRALKRSYKDGVARFNAYLEDYALMAEAMVDMYEASMEPRHLEAARNFAEAIINRFADPQNGGFFFTADDHEELIARSKPVFDGSTPSGNSSAVMAFLRLGSYTGEERYLAEAKRTIESFARVIEKQPFGFSRMLEAVDLYERGPTDIVVVGPRHSMDTAEWLSRIGGTYLPNLAIFLVDPEGGDAPVIPEPAQGKEQIDGKVTVYVCRDRTCSAPITSLDDLDRALEG